LPTTRAAIFLLLFLLALLPGCEKKLLVPPHDNERPVASFSRAPSRSGDLYSYTYELEWTGFDPDGELRGFKYAIDPPAPTTAAPSPETTWVSTTAFGGTFEFKATQPLPGVPGTEPLAADYHVFVLEAFDDHGLNSVPITVAFNASTIAPTARIVTPAPSSRYRQFLPPSFTVTWEGSDLDGTVSKQPIFYRVKVLSGSTPITPALMATYPDTLLHYYVPRGWATWDSLGPDVHTFSLSTLAPLQDYVFVVIAFDEAGAYTPYASGDVNALAFRALYANNGGPKLTIFNDFFSYTYSNGVYTPADRGTWVNLEVPSGIPLTFNWSAVPQEGTVISYYRWVLDTENLNDDTPRTNERTDLSHWSVHSSTIVSATLPPFVGNGDHLLYIEAGDGNGLRSLAVIHLTTVAAAFAKPLAICDDTRLKLDGRSPGSATCISAPVGRFPTAAELDTFLYARGGVPIKCYPSGSVSRQGLFWGYDFDTLNMRPGHNDETPSLALLGRYRHLIWLVDPAAAVLHNAGGDLVSGETTMRYMNEAGHLNTLAAYLRQGGQVWVAGGGAISASNPGRFAYDFVHWRGQYKTGAGPYPINFNTGRLAGTGAYSAFPPSIGAKSLAAGDSMPAWRTITTDVYLNNFSIEALVGPNSIVEDFDPSASGIDLRSAMDTLYTIGAGGLLPFGSPIMTVYHGTENSGVVATGFDLWSYNRAQLKQVIDGVLQGIWGMVRHAPATALVRAGPTAAVRAGPTAAMRVGPTAIAPPRTRTTRARN